MGLLLIFFHRRDLPSALRCTPAVLGNIPIPLAQVSGAFRRELILHIRVRIVRPLEPFAIRLGIIAYRMFVCHFSPFNLFCAAVTILKMSRHLVSFLTLAIIAPSL